MQVKEKNKKNTTISWPRPREPIRLFTLYSDPSSPCTAGPCSRGAFAGHLWCSDLPYFVFCLHLLYFDNYLPHRRIADYDSERKDTEKVTHINQKTDGIGNLLCQPVGATMGLWTPVLKGYCCMVCDVEYFFCNETLRRVILVNTTWFQQNMNRARGRRLGHQQFSPQLDVCMCVKWACMPECGLIISAHCRRGWIMDGTTATKKGKQKHKFLARIWSRAGLQCVHRWWCLLGRTKNNPFP